MPDQPGLFSAAQLADAGMNRAAEHADAANPKWTDRAFQMVLDFAKTRHEFMGEEVRQWAHRQGLPLPPDGRAWGFVIVRAIRAEVIECAGYRNTRIPPAHATPRAIWRSNIYREQAEAQSHG